jgi:hypothetical protein
VQVVDEHPVQEFMNKIKSLLRRSHNSPSRLILRQANRGIRISGFFESHENEGIPELALTPAEHNEDYVRRGRDAACHGYAIATGQRRSDLESLAREFIGNDPVFCPQLPKRIPRQDDNWFMLEP